jgi:mono/diheme cytochrome c family protein
LKVVGDKAFEAAEQQDVEELFRVGAELYQVCVACHQTYMTD